MSSKIPVTFNNPEDVASSLRDHLNQYGGRLVGIVTVEGFSTSGKSWLSRKLESALGGARLSLDSFLEKDSLRDTYVKCLDLHQVQASLESLKDKLVIVDGLASAEAIERLQLKADSRIYVKRMTQVGLWADDPQYAVGSSPNVTDRWAIEYERRKQPQKSADIIFENCQDLVEYFEILNAET